MFATLALVFAASAHADEEVDALRGHLTAISVALYTMDSDTTGMFRTMALDAQHHTQELAPLIMGLEASIPEDVETDIGERVLAQVLSLNEQLTAVTEVSGAEWRAATGGLVSTSIILTELSTALIHTAEPYRTDPVAFAD